jgi:uncharacterized repeat protein (TIGR03803 family)
VKQLIVFVLFATAISLPAQIFTTLHSFDSIDGKYPTAGLVQAPDGSLYGTTSTGGAKGAGTVFKITPRGELTTLHNFDYTDGNGPQGLVLAYGALYGTTSGGGGFQNATFFKMAADGTLTTLHTFNSNIDGSCPSTLILGSDGDFYGTTSGCANGNTGLGTVFKITPQGAVTTLHTFCSQLKCPDGAVPVAALVQASDGDFYGTTRFGGINPFCRFGSAVGCGTVFKITSSGVLTTVYSFCLQANCTDGEAPSAGLVQSIWGDLYGTTIGGGARDSCFGLLDYAVGCGTVFKITPGGALTTLHTFDLTDGANPDAALIQATDGNFYGTTSVGGAFMGGTVFMINAASKTTTLYGFGAASSGGEPYAPLIKARNGSFYGTTFAGPGTDYGTVFRLEVFVKTLPSFGGVGCAVRIVGTNLTGATSVTFNGTPAIFEVVSPFEIVTRVPPGASSGEVEVITPSGMLWSNVPFQVP